MLPLRTLVSEATLNEEDILSRGPGRWQRVLLNGLEQSPFIGVGGTVWSHLGRPATRAEEVAARRAAKRLVETGRARAIYRRLPRVDKKNETHQLVLTRLDYLMPSNLVPLNASRWVDTTTSIRGVGGGPR